MELRGTIKSISDFEDMLLGGIPNKLIHDGGVSFPLLGTDHTSKAYSRQHQLFPFGGQELWEDRVNVRFYYDLRSGFGTCKISEEGTQLLGKRLREVVVAARVNGEGV